MRDILKTEFRTEDFIRCGRWRNWKDRFLDTGIDGAVIFFFFFRIRCTSFRVRFWWAIWNLKEKQNQALHSGFFLSVLQFVTCLFFSINLKWTGMWQTTWCCSLSWEIFKDSLKNIFDVSKAIFNIFLFIHVYENTC